MTFRPHLLSAVVLIGLVVGCAGGEASDDGTALLINVSHRDDLRVYVFDGSDRPLRDAALDPAFRFDTQVTDRERQCLVAGDGSFEVRGADGEVLIEHDFADREVCEREELTVNEDLELVWVE